MASGGGIRQRDPRHGARNAHGLVYWRQVYGMDDGSKPIAAQKPGGAVAALIRERLVKVRSSAQARESSSFHVAGLSLCNECNVEGHARASPRKCAKHADSQPLSGEAARC